MKMKKLSLSVKSVLGLLSLVSPSFLSASVEFDALIPQVAFAGQELENAVKEAGCKDLKIAVVVRPDPSSPESFKLRYVDSQLWVIGSDAKGAMYGGLEVADRLRLGLPIEAKDYEPFVEKRGIKFNIPFDVRTPSYDDSGDSAQNNIETVWDFEFWKEFFDNMARYRYNVLSLWTAHPYPSIVKLDDYPDAALEDVYRMGLPIDQDWRKSGNPGPWGPWNRDLNEPGVMKLVKKITIEEKVEYWRKVFNYAEDRGIEVSIFHWNVFTFGATGKDGITQAQANPITVDYLYKSVREALLTYPQISGIGVTAGENADDFVEGEHSIENFIFKTYGRAIMDVREQQPERKISFIFRQHKTGLEHITEAFADFPYEFETSFKYAIGHMYSMTRPVLFEDRFRDQVEDYGFKCWFNLRNDDMFVLRWGNPDFTREFLQKMPHHLSPGFYMGSDGYVWGREFISKNPETSGRLEIDKHWYQFRQWGQLAYNPELGRDYWTTVLEQRFPGVNGDLLYETWASVSEIVPQVNRANFTGNDAHFAPEGCMGLNGFLTVDDYYFDSSLFNPMQGSGIISVIDWGKATAKGEKLEGITPLEVSDNLDAYAAKALAALPALRETAGDNIELKETLNDIESMAYLGRYYADKMRAGAKIAVFRKDSKRKEFHNQAVNHLEDAVEDWRAYAAIASSQYKVQLMARTHYMDWNWLLGEVEKEVVTIRNEGNPPAIQFTNLKDRERLPADSDLTVKVQAKDRDGIKQVKLYLNGLLINQQEQGFWNASSDVLLKALKPGMYHLEAVAEDNTGTYGRKAIEITVGDVPTGSSSDWRNEIHQVFLEEDERLMGGSVVDFPRLECYFTIDDVGRMTLEAGSPGKSEEQLWNSWGRKLETPQFAMLEEGRLLTMNTDPNQPTKLYKTDPVSIPGPFKLGITVSRKLVLYSENEAGEKRVVWRTR